VKFHGKEQVLRAKREGGCEGAFEGYCEVFGRKVLYIMAQLIFTSHPLIVFAK
jgi:hypothetical protein